MVCSGAGPAGPTGMGVRRRFPPVPASVPDARRFVAAVIHEFRVDDPAVSDLALLSVTELASNAVLHAGGELEVVVDVQPDQIVVGVADSSPSPPVLAGGEPGGAPGGDGMRVLAAIARRWGTTPQGEGKVVWCALAVLRRSP